MCSVFGQIYQWNSDPWMKCKRNKKFKRNVRTKLGSLLKFRVRQFSLLITKVSIRKYNSYNWISDCNATRTHNHLICKWTLNHLTKLASFAKGLSGCGFESSCNYSNFRYVCFEQGVHSHSGYYWVWIHSKTCAWHNN